MSRPARPVASVLGIGSTPFYRRSGRSVVALAAQAALLALADAGLRVADVDAVVPVGGSVSCDDLVSVLGVPETVFDALPAPGGNSGVSALAVADALLAAGRAEVALVVFARNGRSENRIASRVTDLPGQQFRAFLERPHGWVSPAQWYSMIARRHMAEFGTTKAAMAEVALAARAHAQHNPQAMMFGRELTAGQYDAAPMITEPYQLFDCCLETDGAVALVISHRPRDVSRDVRLLAVRSARPESPDDLTNRRDWFEIGLTAAAKLAFEDAGLGPQDVDTAMIYDCFTFEVLHQLEEAGFCPRGESGRFVLAGAIRLGGVLPVNTHGGLLSEGHLLGLSHVAEAVRQLRHEAGGRQVDGARIAAVTGWGDWGDGSLALLARAGVAA
jgi:acetyl-CoA acetyltransferase